MTSGIKEVIRVLGFIQEYFDNHADEQEPNERKELFVNWSDTVLEAITLLKAQEPRVMTLEEAENADYCWLESQEDDDVTILEPVLRNGGWAEGIGFTNGINCDYDCVPNEYNIVWRCWTSRPDEKRRAETPWES